MFNMSREIPIHTATRLRIESLKKVASKLGPRVDLLFFKIRAKSQFAFLQNSRRAVITPPLLPTSPPPSTFLPGCQFDRPLLLIAEVRDACN